MWRNLAAVLLMPSLMAAQAEQDRPAPTAQPAESAPKLSEQAQPKPATLRQYTFYDAIRRGRSEEAAVELSVKGFVTVPQSPVAGIVPVKLEFQPSENLTFSKFRYPKPKFRKKVISQPKSILVLWGQPTIRFKLKADDLAALGPRVLSGKITFQIIRMDSSLGPVEQLDVMIPITVAEHNAKVRRAKWPYWHTPVTLFVLAPLLIPVMLVYYPICAILGPQKCPD